jgi:hypothetical protein
MVDTFAQAAHLRRSIEQVTLEAIQCLWRQHDASRFGVLSSLAQDIGTALTFVLSRPLATKHFERRVQRPAQHIGTKCLATIDRPLQTLDRRSPHRGTGIDWIVFGRESRRTGSLQADAVQHRSNLLVVRYIAVKQRHFDPVKATLLDERQLWFVLVGYVGSPKQQVDSKAHGKTLAASRRNTHRVTRARRDCRPQVTALGATAIAAEGTPHSLSVRADRVIESAGG